MPALPVLSGREVVRVFEKFGWEVDRHPNHIVMVKDGHHASLAIPDHKEVAKGTLRKLIRIAGLSVAEFHAAI